MIPLEIKIDLIEAGETQADIARQIERSRSRVNRVINEPDCVSAPVWQAIAEAISRPVADIWPDDYMRQAS